MPYKTRFTPVNTTKYIGDPNNIICRSLWERKFCKFLDENANIIRWSFETLKIPYKSPVDNLLHYYIPDFIVEKKNKKGDIETMIVEIKPAKQTKKPEMGKRKSKRSCESNSWKFVILTEKELFDGNK